MIYFDSSALVKLIAPEPESVALSEWVRARLEQPRITSAISQVDVLRTFREQGPAIEDLATIVLSKLDRLPVKQDVLDGAAALRSRVSPLEAIHLASACKLREGLHAYVSYDGALLAAAAEEGLATASPGA
ncbi:MULTISPECIES: PIN domain-containing protein [Saccharopolyspora]|uniref:Type II toxin-antitoxin system VapC family toxin n=1 Tax=Saccharopolyspora gregorii TaxID=33914 RepID=A0ABP6RMK2_9PSEU|nr:MULTISPECIES: PIN domain-containing protein [Saccharopolyspora]MCA1187489.1 PIN domain-containing protein [Saccharopolyspora sp. 6T]MCA1194718.1 PIN domain-containing protein [Saccharopolyspora sp. 6V]MCA1225876.1 PIN domain-containing protein [Saccharopolyspora sp. 6M]MCA1280594.1 PIN domain-containing protein [Saccharopolyspora sp. 7B]